MPRDFFDPLDPNVRYQDAPPPEGGYNVTNPHLNRPRATKERAFMAARERNPMTDPAQATRTVDLSDKYDESRGGGPLRGADLVQFTGNGQLNPEQYADVVQQAMVMNGKERKPMTATMNGVNYTYTPRIKVNDQKAQMYLQDAAARRAETTKQEQLRAQKLERDRVLKMAEREQESKNAKEYLDLEQRGQADLQRIKDEGRKNQRLAEREDIENRVSRAKAETAEYDASREGRMARERAEVGKKLIGSEDATTRRAGAGLVGESIGVDNFENAVRGSYESRIGELRPLIEQVKKSMSSSGHGFYRSPEDVKRTEFLMQQVRQRASNAGFTPEEIQLIESEMMSGERGGGIGDFFDNLINFRI